MKIKLSSEEILEKYLSIEEISDALKIYQKILKNDQTNPPNFAFLCVNHVIVNSKYT